MPTVRTTRFGAEPAKTLTLSGSPFTDLYDRAPDRNVPGTFSWEHRAAVTHRDTIQAFLASVRGPVCDDCLSTRAGITPRQTVNLNCRRMEKPKQITCSEIIRRPLPRLRYGEMAV